jgi:hypothetical protein
MCLSLVAYPDYLQLGGFKMATRYPFKQATHEEFDCPLLVIATQNKKAVQRTAFHRLERANGFEPSTSTLARLRSTN